MDKKFFIANWKSNKTKEEAVKFFEYVRDNISHINLSDKEVVVAPPYTLLSKCRHLIDEYGLPIKLCSQNVSSYPQGAYTGEINAKQVKDYAEYVLVGHSERRKYLHESESDIENKIRESKEAGLFIIQCVQDESSVVHNGVEIIAYEPPSAIGSGNPDDPQHVGEVFEELLKANPTIKLLYGGSVNNQSIHTFKNIPSLSGFLIGGASLEPESFLSLLS